MAQIKIEVTEKGINPTDAKLKKLGKTGQQTEKQMGKTSKAFKDFGESASDSIALLDGPMGGLSSRVTSLSALLRGGPVGLAAGFAAVSVAAYATTSAIATTVREMDNMARIAGQTINEYKSSSFAAMQYGVTVEQLGDAFKDTSERIGDFISTGGGPLQDFGDVMGYTKAQTLEFAKSVEGLSGQNILIKMVSELESAGKSSEQMSFALEGMASDMTKLLPLLSDGGKEFKTMQDAMNAVTVPISEEEVSLFREFKKSVDLVSGSMTSLMTSAVIPLLKPFTELNNAVSFFFASMNEGTTAALSSELVDLNERSKELKLAIEDNESAWGRLKNVASFESTDSSFLKKQLEDVEKQIDVTTEKLNRISFGDPTTGGPSSAKKEAVTVNKEITKTVGEKDAAAAAQKKIDAINKEQEAIRALYMTEEELSKLRYDNELSRIQNGQFSKEEARALELESEADHLERLAALKDESAERDKKRAFDVSGVVSSSISGSLIAIADGAETGEDAIIGIAKAIRNSLVQELVDVGVEYVKNEALSTAMATTQKANIASTTAAQTVATAATTTSTVAAAGTVAAASAAPAALTSTWSFGSAALVGGAALLGTLAIASAARFQGGQADEGGSYNWQERGGEAFAPKVGGRIFSKNDMKSIANGGNGGSQTMVVNVYNETGASVTAVKEEDGSSSIYVRKDELSGLMAYEAGNADSEFNQSYGSIYETSRRS